MKKLLLLLFLIPTMLFAQECYTVKAVTTEVEMEEISQRRITFGIIISFFHNSITYFAFQERMTKRNCQLRSMNI